ncbi:: DUF3108 [Gemmata massiliana]|uniref:: DUF3108 n=1 Tax=Gemmata massiliana TaxID=1210884 RepID=A0A6P2CZ31_9BACT|nr:hypothetical protein [Gemmata massiliana]VTR94231.1 : DUF3108 [Gemmata massiliana]
MMQNSLLFAVACLAFASPVPKMNGAVDYFPTVVGDKWIYVLIEDGMQSKNEIEEEVTSVDVSNGVKTIKISRLHTNDGKMYYNRERDVSANGVFQSKDDDGKLFDHSCIYLNLPHKEGGKWTNDKFGETLTAYGPENVKVPAGEFVAIRVEHRKQGDAKTEPTCTYWYAPKVGIVKISLGKSEIVMKSFTPGKK